MTFSEAELKKLQDAVAEAEARTSGEIVPYIVPQSGEYDVAVWRGASMLAVLSLAVSLLVYQFYHGWGLAWLFTGWGTGLLVLVAATVGALLGAYVAPIRRMLIGEAIMARAVHRRSMQAFVEEEVFKTRDRTGILLFISVFEHRVEVLGDSGINQAVSDDDWAEIVRHLCTGVKQGRLAESMVEAFEMCGHLLEKRGVEIRHDDTNELSNEVRVRKS